MLDFCTLVAQYNASLPTLVDGQYGAIAQDSNGRLIQDHSTASIAIGDASNLIDLVQGDAAGSIAKYGLMAFGIRKDTLASLVTADGDFTTFEFNAKGELYVKDTDAASALGNIDTVLDNIYAAFKQEDSVHVSGDLGIQMLAVRHDADGALCADGDYASLQVNSQGELKVAATVEPAAGVEGDVGADELGAQTEPGVIPAIGTAAWVDIVSIPVAAGVYHVTEIDGSADKLCQFRLVVDDNAVLVKYIRNFLVTENMGTMSLVFPRPIEIAGGATVSLKLQAKRLRVGAADANCSGGINGYTL